MAQDKVDPSESAIRIKELHQTETVCTICQAYANLTSCPVSPHPPATSVLQRVIKLIETAGHAIRVLSGEEEKGGHMDDGATNPDHVASRRRTEDERLAAFQKYAEGYFELLDEIQRSLRSHTHHLASAGMLAASSAASIPFHASIYGEQKELELWTRAVGLLHRRVEGIRRAGEEEGAGMDANADVSIDTAAVEEDGQSGGT
ncbi:hypothetical protein BC937DRAFT_90632 [Endogone sp. FLAS-F59071]|nr:hypothetical protein BC937DRAFT_90632 [Endogone sp. FLAS-F59071]|eukprot:RUS16935.1 hypothetical protein BC937DRAFT_90632 [Endogone sp. FLAS-F59071]